jgi:addiction module HigA family antidote
MRKVAPVSPGEMLEEEFLKPLGMTKYRLAKEIGVPPQRIGDIVSGKRSITAAYRTAGGYVARRNTTP